MLAKKFLMQVLRLIEASEAVLEEKQWQQFAASGSCTLSTNEKPRSIVPECSRPIAIVPKPGGGGPKSLFPDGAYKSDFLDKVESNKYFLFCFRSGKSYNDHVVQSKWGTSSF